MNHQFYKPKCTKCRDVHFTKPPGKPEMAGPCDKCNPEGNLPLDNDRYVPDGSDKFPMGKHKDQGHTYNQVPDSYFLWFIDQPWAKSWPQIVNYIERNFKDELA